MKVPGFIGGSDTQRSLNLSDNKCINLYPVTNNNGNVAGFYKVDGLKAEGTLAGVPSGAYKASNGRAFYTSGTTLYELTVPAGVYTSTSRGTVTSATNYEFSDNGLEMIMVNGVDGWLFTFSTNTLSKLTVLSGNFTVQPATAVDVDATLTSTAHGLAAGDRVILSTTGSLPSNLLPLTPYYVLDSGFTVNTFKVGLSLTGNNCTISNASPCVVTSASHGFVTGDKVRFLTTGALPSPLVVGTAYYVISEGITQDTFKISTTLDGAGINTTTSGSGTHSFNPAITVIQPATGICSISSTSAVGGSCSISYASPAVITKAAHGLVGGEKIIISDNPVPGGETNLPGGITPYIQYFVLSSGLTTDTFKISLTDGGSAINTSSAGVNPQIYTVVPSGYITSNTENSLKIGDAVMFSTSGVLPSGVSQNTKYFVTGYQNVTFDLGYAYAPYFHSVINKWLFLSGLRIKSTDKLLTGKIGQKLRFKTNGILPTLLNEETEYSIIPTPYPDYYMVTLDNEIVGGSGYQHDTTDIPVTTGLGSGIHTYTFKDSFSIVASKDEIYGTRIPISGTQSGIHSYFNEGNVAFGNHTFKTGGAAFPNGAKTVSYMNGRFVACEPNTQNFYVSEVLDGRTWEEINVQTVDSNPDYVTGQIVSHNELIVFCENSGETYYDSGTVPTPFVRNLTGIFEVGCKAPYTIAEMDNTVFFLGNTKNGNGIIYKLVGLTPTRISTYDIEYQIQQMADISDARAFTYQKDGHHFYVLTFPTGNKTFVYDANTNLWHERSKIIGFENGQVTEIILTNSGTPSVLPAITLTAQSGVSTVTSGIKEIIWCSAYYFAITDSKAFKSSDGSTWTQIVNANILQIMTSVSTNGINVCILNITYPPSAKLTTDNGSTWNSYLLPEIPGNSTGFYSSNWNNIKYGFDKYVATCNSEYVYSPYPVTLYIATSPDGITWTQRSVPAGIKPVNGGDSGVSCLAFNGAIWVYASSYAETNNAYATSPDGITWTARTLPTIVGTRVNLAITTNGSTFLLISWDATNSIMYSALSIDGINWTQTAITLPLLQKNPGFLLTCLNNAYVISGGGNNIYRSLDGITWSMFTIPGNAANFNRVANNGTTAVIAGRDNVSTYFTTSKVVQSSYIGGTYNLTFTGTNITPATGTYTVSSETGKVSAINLTNGGSGYSIAPSISFLYGGIASAAATSDIYTGILDNNFYEWPVNKYLYYNQKHLATDSTTSLFSIDSSTYKNGTNPIRIVRSFRAPASDMKRVAHHSIQVDCEVGVGTGIEPVIALRWSDDAGKTWSTPIERGLGLAGNYSKSVVFRRLGATKGIPRIYELSSDENIKITLLDCYLE